MSLILLLLNHAVSSQALDKSIRIVPTIPDESNSFCHFWRSLKSACCVEWALRKPQSNLFRKVSAYSYSWSYIIFSNTLDNKDKTLTGLKFVLSVGSTFLNTGTISKSFRVSGNLFSLKALLIHSVSSLKQNSEFVTQNSHFLMQLLLQTCQLFNSNTLFNFLIPFPYLYWKWLVIITSKSITHFTKKTACFIRRHSSQRLMIYY